MFRINPMHIESFRDYCLTKSGVEECFPFDEDTLVFKVKGKMFALCALEKDPVFVNLKCDPDKALELRTEYPEVTPGYHMNRKLWNSIVLHPSISDKLMRSLIDHSYDLVVASLPKYKRVDL